MLMTDCNQFNTRKDFAYCPISGGCTKINTKNKVTNVLSVGNGFGCAGNAFGYSTLTNRKNEEADANNPNLLSLQHLQHRHHAGQQSHHHYEGDDDDDVLKDNRRRENLYEEIKKRSSTLIRDSEQSRSNSSRDLKRSV